MTSRSIAASLAMLVSCLLASTIPAFAADAPTKAEAEAYIDKITKTHARLNETGKSFGRLLGGALKGEPKDQLALYRVFREMAQLIWKIQLETNEFAVPDHETALGLKAANNRFLSYQREAVLSKIPALLEVVDDATLEAEAKQEKILAMITKDNDREVELGNQVKAAIAALRAAAE